jgi:putative nucleotidyltransferase with HDIG domain
VLGLSADTKIIRLRIYVSVITVLGVAAFLLALRADRASDLGAPATIVGVLTFAVLGLALELAGHKLTLGGAGGSIAFVVFLGASLVYGPTWGAAISAVGVASAQILNRRPFMRVVFNAAQYVLAVVAGSLVYIYLGGSTPPTSFGASFPPFLGFIAVFFFVNSAAVSGAVALSHDKDFLEVWTLNTLNLAIYDLVASVLALGIAWLYVKSGLGAMAAVVVPILFLWHTYTVNLQLQTTNRERLELMVKAIEARDPYTSGHSQRVAELARSLAKGLHVGFKEVENISTAALLHDVGKIYEEFAPILRKETRLTAEEKALMQTHPVRSAELVGTISSLHGYVYRAVRHHHENFDGTGYPDGLAGEQIPVGARIIMVADTVDAMTTDRPYRTALPFSRVVEELRRHAGRQFDPKVVEAFERSTVARQVIAARVPHPSEAATVSSGEVLQPGGGRSAPVLQA